MHDGIDKSRLMPSPRTMLMKDQNSPVIQPGLDGCRSVDSEESLDPNSWPERDLRALEMVLQTGDCDWLQGMLEGVRVARVLALGRPQDLFRIEAVTSKLADARLREDVAGGPGSLINPKHHLMTSLKKAANLAGNPHDLCSMLEGGQANSFNQKAKDRHAETSD